jgi:hypothetical protein
VEVTEGGRKLRSVVLRDLYSLLGVYQIMEDEMDERCSMHGGVTNECEIFRP